MKTFNVTVKISTGETTVPVHIIVAANDKSEAIESAVYALCNNLTADINEVEEIEE